MEILINAFNNTFLNDNCDCDDDYGCTCDCDNCGCDDKDGCFGEGYVPDDDCLIGA